MFPRILAIVLPAAILALVVYTWGQAPAERVKSEAATRFETTLARAGADVVLVGNSKVDTDIDRRVLSQGLDGLRVASVAAHGSRTAAWYAVLENRVFRAGHRPKLVVVYSPLAWLFQLETGGEQDRNHLADNEGAEEPVLDRKLGRGSGAGSVIGRLRRELGNGRDVWNHRLRDVSVGLFFARGAPEGLEAGGKAVADPALSTLFGVEANTGERARVIPIVEEERVARGAGMVALEDTLIADFLALAKENGARIVFVRAPLATEPRVASEVELAFARLVEQNGGGYLDIRGSVPDTAFGDGVHMNAFGRERLTAALVTGLAGLDALGTGPMHNATVRVPPRITRTGTGPTLPEITPQRGPHACGWEAPTPTLSAISDPVLEPGVLASLSPITLSEDGTLLSPHAPRARFADACAGAFAHQLRFIRFSPSGDSPKVVPNRTYTLGLSTDVPLMGPRGEEGWWVYPGTTLSFAWDAAWEGEATSFGAALVARTFGDGAGVPTLTVADGPAVPITGADGRATARWSGPRPTGPWAITITSPADGPWILLRRLAVGTASDAPWVLVGADTERPVALLRGAPTWAKAPADLGPISAPVDVDTQVVRLDVGALGVPADDEVARRASIRSLCSPLRLAADGVPLPAPNQKAAEVGKAPGRYAHQGASVLLSIDGIAGKTLTASLEPTRKCDRLLWLYPGDAVRLDLDTRVLQQLDRAGEVLQLGGAPMTASAASLSVRLVVDEAEVYSGEIPLDSLLTAPPNLPLASTVPVHAKSVALELSTPADAPYVLLTTAALVERPLALFPAGGE